MTENEATEFLLKCSRFEGSEVSKQDARQLVQILGYFPLAIEQAGGFIRTTGNPIAQYMSLYEMNQSEFYEEELPKSHKVYYQNTVATTWKISFARIAENDLLANEILQLMIFLDGSKIQKELFTAGREVLTDNWGLSEATPLTIERSLQYLQTYSLIRILEGNDIGIHPLVQQVMLADIKGDASLYFHATLKLVYYRFPWGYELANINTCQKYLAQAQLCTKYGIKFKSNAMEMTWLLDSLGGYFDRNGQYAEAVAQYERSLTIKEKAFGVDHINTANTIASLGNTYDSQGKYDEAIAQYERALKIKEKALGVDHINTADTINNLGNTYSRQGKYDEAITQYERALKIKQKAFGVDHINTANTINNLGSTYYYQGKYDEAMAQYERALRIFETAFGADHINTADTINNLGNTYSRQGKYDEAIAQYERALKIYEKAFGVDHINTANTINNLGSTYYYQGKYDEAMAQYERALRIFETAFGVDHINTADTIMGIGVTYDSQGKYDEAVAQYERALKIYEKAFGVDHINTADTIMNVGLVYNSQNQIDLAKPWLHRSYEIFLNHLGEHHPNTRNAVRILRNLETQQSDVIKETVAKPN
jgi:tetratricopeptide (TPR) repeat protein